jgi:hypothetical protein
VTLRQGGGRVDGRLLLSYQSPTSEYYLVGLGGDGSAYSIVHFSMVTGWHTIAAAAAQNLRTGRSYAVAIQIRGQRIGLEIDGVRVLEHILDAPLPSGQLGLFAWGEGGAMFSNIFGTR